MKHLILSAVLALSPAHAIAQNSAPIIADVVNGHILPGFDALAARAAGLAHAAENECSPNSVALQTAYGHAFDAWISVSHLRFGPTEENDRAFALAFWPDTRGVTPRSLSKLIATQDSIAESPAEYQQVSIAARGFYALEFLLFDDRLRTAADPNYHCRLIQTITQDIQANSQAIKTDWHEGYAAQILTPRQDGLYRTEEEILQELFKTLTTGLQFTSETRLARPLGSFDKPRPKRAESWRSGRTAQHLQLSLHALGDLAARLSGANPALREKLKVSFELPIAQILAINDPTLAGVSDPQQRFKIEVIQQSVNTVREVVENELGPVLGVSAGFNALDGD
ncbi:imelysin family protein [Planktotalea sp.]|uniref:imelysin family protein n=1 Tax=Planktotalea sp. TaxID=2029877 RepID=UPI003D6AA4E6